MTATTTMQPASTGHKGFDLSDWMMLEEHVLIGEEGACDSLTGRHLLANETAQSMLRMLADGGVLRDLIRRHAERYAIGVSEAERDVRRIIERLDAVALLVTYPARVRRLHPILLVPAAVRVAKLEWFDPPARRYPPTVAGLIRGTARACRASIIGGLMASIGLLALFIFLTLTDAPALAERMVLVGVNETVLLTALPLLLALCLTLQLAAHEGGHLMLARHYGASSFMVVRRATTLAAERRKLEGRRIGRENGA